MMMIISVIILIDGHEAVVSRIGSFGPAEALLDEEKRKNSIPVGRQPLASLPLNVVVFNENLSQKQIARNPLIHFPFTLKEM